MRTYCRENEPFANITQSFIVFNATDRHPFNTESLSQAKLFMEAISVSWELHRRHFHPAKIKSTRIVATPGVSGNAYVGYADRDSISHPNHWKFERLKFREVDPVRVLASLLIYETSTLYGKVLDAIRNAAVIIDEITFESDSVCLILSEGKGVKF
jgi:hypothetical protein